MLSLGCVQFPSVNSAEFTYSHGGATGVQAEVEQSSGAVCGSGFTGCVQETGAVRLGGRDGASRVYNHYHPSFWQAN